ncbi:MAG: COX15/CtaA family protein [Pseudomonadota bacterium]
MIAVRVLIPLLVVLTFGVITYGASVRLADAGLGCPDWPGCYGELLLVESEGELSGAEEMLAARPFEYGKARKEMVHRYIATVLGLGILILNALVWLRAGWQRLRPLAAALLGVVLFQGALGMWTVTLLLKPLVVSAHLLGGMLIFALMGWLLLNVLHERKSHRPETPINTLLIVALALVFFQIFLGGWTSANYAALACTDFPKCQGAWWPNMNFSEAFVLWRGLGINYEFGVLDSPSRTAIQVAHRIGAGVVASYLCFVVFWALRSPRAWVRRSGWCILVALGAQLALGVSNVVLGLPLHVAVAHNGVAALLLMSIVAALFFSTYQHDDERNDS